MPAARPSGANALDRDLRPSAGRRAQIDDTLTWLQKLCLVVDLNQLEGRPRDETKPLRLRHVRIVQLAL